MNVELTLTQDGRTIGSYRLIEPGEYTLGCDPACSIPVEDSEMSHQHARLRLSDSELLLEDLGSSNGTFVDTQRIQQAIAVKLGQKIQLGATVLEVRSVADDASASADVTVVPRASVPGPAAPTLPRVRHLQQYELGSEVARGGMGAVLSARDLGLKRKVAMKVALDELIGAPDLLQRFEQEAEITGQLEHPGIVPVHELGTDEQGRAFYTMKFVQGVNLHDVLEKIKAGDADTIAKYPLSHLLTIFQKVCDAVAFAHSKGVIHRDLKPANIMIGEYGEVLVMDWGLAKVVNGINVQHSTSNVQHRTTDPNSVAALYERREEEDGGHRPPLQESGLTMSGQIMGTPQFMAPEQAEGKIEEIDARSDIFSLGAILYNILTLHPPVTGDNVQEILDKIRAGEIAHPSAYNPKSRSGILPDNSSKGDRRDACPTMPRPPLFPLRHCPGNRVPESLSAVTMKALALKKEDRYQSVPELQKDIAAYQGGFATRAEHAGTLKLLWLLIKRHKTLFLVSHAALLIVVIVVAAFSIRNAATLRQLRGTAPTFYGQAQALIRQQRFDDALEKISYALALRPDEAEYQYQKGNILQTLLRLPEAVLAYQQALQRNPQHALADENLKLCQKLIDESAGKDQPPPASLHALYLALRHQGRFDEALTIVPRLKEHAQVLYEETKASMAKAGVPGKLELLEDGTMALDLSGTSVTDLSPLKGMPITKLNLRRTKVSSLTPLRGMPLRELYMEENPISDLSPLKGMPMNKLMISGLPVTDIGPLRGMPLKELQLQFCSIRDITPLGGMPLTKLHLGNLLATDFSVIRGMLINDLSIQLSEFSDLTLLQNMPLEHLNLGYNPRLSDLGPLRGMKLRTLVLNKTSISDLRPLRGMQLYSLHLCDTPVRDLSPLSGIPLHALFLGGTQMCDFRSLADIPQLEYLVIPHHCREIESLRQLTNLKSLSNNPDWNAAIRNNKPVAEFWKEYDAKK